MNFKSVHDYEKFAHTVRTKRRFIYPDEVTAFLQAVIDTGKSREAILKAGHTLWRAQIGYREWRRQDNEGHEWVEEAPFAPERMTPLTRNPSEGRSNPRGIAYLYLATDSETAIAETRPWSGSLVSVASFQTKRDLRLVDFSKNHGKAGGWGYLIGVSEDRWDKLTAEEIEQAVWADIDNAFARPVGPNDPHVDYVPTQIIAELIRDKDFDGIGYKSSFSENGYNVALFDVDAAELKVCHLFDIKGVKYKSDECANPWFVQDGKFVTNVITDIRPIDEMDTGEGSDKIEASDNSEDIT